MIVFVTLWTIWHVVQGALVDTWDAARNTTATLLQGYVTGGVWLWIVTALIAGGLALAVAEAKINR